MFSDSSSLSRVGECYGRLVEREWRCGLVHREVRILLEVLVFLRLICLEVGRTLELGMLLWS